ncbi:uncharacterized protein ACA1_101330 [Acanthamoeba castellanii str. Neff]|uniref:t-SNARE coiled-coil homology domain-containing protein n=1 Tax=Acanthamoeba castellanii (strain ATCC 30010 / Neff) TaxID=1257118 RepID=L8GGH6_ACACF|nr:uncharacterized protein ACA1_101330 [Acanthamoeba castellanii str. Neff]ELR12072.1 hypothetical protein ACA1_101330 [Acanthamoeba castellanii str. Neff]
MAVSIAAEVDTQSCLLDRIDAQTELVEARNFMGSAKSLSSSGVGSFFSGLAAAVSSPFKSLSATNSGVDVVVVVVLFIIVIIVIVIVIITCIVINGSGCDARAAALEKLVLLQRANGTWTLEAMEDFLKISLPLPALIATDETVSLLWATLVALAVLERVFDDKRDEWRLLAQKATLWVKRSTANEPSTLSELTALSLAMDLPSDLTSLNN